MKTLVKPLDKPSFKAIPQIPRANYRVDVPWGRLDRHISSVEGAPLVLCPDYQRGRVWSTEQQEAFLEYGYMGGENSMTIITNCPGWMADWRGPYELVDGLQRVTAVLRFLRDEIKLFGYRLSEYKDAPRALAGPSFSWCVCNLPTRAEVLRLYLLLNAGGVVHSPEEVARVRDLLEIEQLKEHLS